MSAVDKFINQITTAKVPETKTDYINTINELLETCNDIPLLDLIFKLLLKSV